MTVELIRPDWPAPPGVAAAATTRAGGVSLAPYDSLNLGALVGDLPERVAANRRLMQAALGLPEAPVWLRQVHGVRVVEAASLRDPGNAQEGGRETLGLTPAELAVLGPSVLGPDADAVWSDRPGEVCAILTADCLPVLFCRDDGGKVAAAHAGWRGLLDGVLEATVAALDEPGERLLAWLGPAIGPTAFEVGEEVRAAFIARDPGAAAYFRPSPAGRWLADLYGLARLRLASVGLTRCYGGDFCTLTDASRFYSYRRDGVTGRMASLIWIR